MEVLEDVQGHDEIEAPRGIVADRLALAVDDLHVAGQGDLGLHQLQRMEVDVHGHHPLGARGQKRQHDPAARAEAESAQARAEQSQQEQRRYREAAKEQEAVFRPTPDIKKLFRKVAQRIHPDRARNEADRTWRTGLMAEANRAYRNGDAATLHEVLAVWEEGRAQTETAPKARSSAMEHQLDLLRRRLTQIQAELDRLLASRMYELLVATRQARRQNRDLLHEMSRKLDSDIANVRATLRMFEAE